MSMCGVKKTTWLTAPGRSIGSAWLCAGDSLSPWLCSTATLCLPSIAWSWFCTSVGTDPPEGWALFKKMLHSKSVWHYSPILLSHATIQIIHYNQKWICVLWFRQERWGDDQGSGVSGGCWRLVVLPATSAERNNSHSVQSSRCCHWPVPSGRVNGVPWWTHCWEEGQN